MHLYYSRNRYSSAHDIRPEKQLNIMKNEKNREDQRKNTQLAHSVRTLQPGHFCSFSKLSAQQHGSSFRHLIWKQPRQTSTRQQRPTGPDSFRFSYLCFIPF